MADFRVQVHVEVVNSRGVTVQAARSDVEVKEAGVKKTVENLMYQTGCCITRTIPEVENDSECP